jgi:hypothetical protein
MAEKKKKSQAEQAASSKTKNKSTAKNTKAVQEEIRESAIPVRLITSVVCLAVFILFLVIFLQPEGAVTKLLEQVIKGLIGSVSFYVAIPALLYLFSIQAFSGKRPIKLRSYCLLAFIGLCGCFSQLFLNASLPTGVSILKFLYDGGVDGTTAGLICGGIALLLKWLFGSWITGIIFVVAAVLTLLAAFSVVLTLTAELIARPLAGVFVGYDAILHDMTTRGFRIYILSFLLSGFNIFGSSFFTALNNGLISALISFLRTLVFQIGAVLLLPLVFELDGIWWSVVAAELGSLALTAFFMMKYRKRYHYG